METDLLKNQIICIESGSRGKGGALTEGIPSVGAEHLQGDGLITWNPNKMKYISPVFFKSLKSGILQKGDVLIVKDGATTGKVAYVSQLPSCAAINEHVFLLRSKPTLYSKFLFYYLQSPVGNHKVMKYYHGATVGGIGKNIVNLEIPLPPLDEQRRIAAVLDKVSGLIAKRRQQLEMLDELVKARFVEMFGDPVTNPMDWPIHRFSEYIEFLTSGSRGWAKYFSDNGEYFITIKNVKNCRITVDDVQHIIPPNNAEAKRTKVQEGDLLISITADLGRTGVVSKEIATHGGYINQHLTCIRIKKDYLNPLYVAYYMESEAGKAQFQSKNQSAVKAGLNFNSINSLFLSVPPLSLQNVFVAFVEQTEKTKATINHSLKKLETLKNSLMQEYFG